MSFADSMNCMLQVQNLQEKLVNINPVDLEFSGQVLSIIKAFNNHLRKNVKKVLRKLGDAQST